MKFRLECLGGAAIGGVLLAAVWVSTPALALDRLVFTTPGAPDELKDVLRGASVLLATKADGATAAQDYLSAARTDYGRLLGALYAEGHYSGVIHITIDGREAAEIAPLDAPATIGTVVVTVTPGPLFSFSRAEVAPLAPGTELPDRFRVGRIARSGVMTDAVDAGIARWRDVGMAKAAASGQEIIADHAKNEVDARFALTPGPRVRFGALNVSGNVDVRTDRIYDIAGFPTGKVFSPDDIDTTAARLRRTGAFKSVVLTEADRLGPGDTLDVGLALVEQPKHRLGFGAEIASLDGAALSGYWLHRNLLGGAESLRLDGAVSGIGGATGGTDYSFGARFNRPATFNPDTSLYVTALIEHVDDIDNQVDRGQVGIGLNRIITDRLSAGVGVAYIYEKITDDLGTYSLSVLSFPFTGAWDRRDDALNPSKGTYLTADITPFVGIHNAGSGGRFFFDARAYKGFGNAERPVVLAGRMQAGAVVGSEILETPTDYLFYSGGGGTVRGQPYQSLGVETDCAGVRGGGAGCVINTGGRSFLGLSGEVRAPIGKNLGLVGFADAGFISADFFDGGDFHAGAGIGVRYNTGIGPIRVDLAAPIGGDTGDGVQFYIGIGQAF